MQAQAYGNHNMNRGYITLMSVLIVGAVGTAIATSMLLLGLDSSRTSFAIEQSNQAKALANACAEEALQQIHDSISYIGNSNIPLGLGTCTYDITSQGGENRTITTEGQVGTITRKVEVVINGFQPSIQIISWQEVP